MEKRKGSKLERGRSGGVRLCARLARWKELGIRTHESQILRHGRRVHDVPFYGRTPTPVPLLPPLGPETPVSRPESVSRPTRLTALVFSLSRDGPSFTVPYDVMPTIASIKLHFYTDAYLWLVPRTLPYTSPTRTLVFVACHPHFMDVFPPARAFNAFSRYVRLGRSAVPQLTRENLETGISMRRFYARARTITIKSS